MSAKSNYLRVAAPVGPQASQLSTSTANRGCALPSQLQLAAPVPSSAPERAITTDSNGSTSEPFLLLQEDAKDAPGKTEVVAALRLLRGLGMPRRGGAKKLEEVRVRLPLFFSGATTAGTTYSTIIAVQPASSSQWSALSALYDEMIVDSGDMHLVLGVETAYTTTAPVIWGVAFDPLDGTALTSTTQLVAHTQHFIWGQGNATFNATPMAVNLHGLHHFHWRTPTGGARASGNPTLFGHEWSSTAETDNYGYIKPYWKSIGATGTTGFEMVIYLHCRFRSRT